MATEMSPAPGFARRADEIQRLQSKLQRSYQEKTMLLAEVQSLKHQVQKNYSQPPGNTAAAVAAAEAGANSIGDHLVAGADKEHWDRLLEAQIRSGTMACLWCIKSQVVKMLAGAFHRWHLQIVVLAGSQSLSTHRKPALPPLDTRPPPGSSSHVGLRGAYHSGSGSGSGSGSSPRESGSPVVSPLHSRRDQIRKLFLVLVLVLAQAKARAQAKLRLRPSSGQAQAHAQAARRPLVTLLTHLLSSLSFPFLPFPSVLFCSALLTPLHNAIPIPSLT